MTFNEQINSQTFATGYTYDDNDREVTHTYPNGDVTRRNYNSYGFLESVDLIASTGILPIPKKLWKVNTRNNYGLATQTQYFNTSGAPLYTFDKTYTPLGYPIRRNVHSSLGQIADFRYVFNPTTGNLTSRRDFIRNFTETFGYDPNFNRLKTATNTAGSPALIMDYDAVGNITQKTDASASIYKWKYVDYSLSLMPEPQTPVVPYTVPQTLQTETYFPFKKVKNITEGVVTADLTY